MRDLQYLDSIYESLEEGIGIRTTKLKPFYDRANGYESQRNPNTLHRELVDPRRRSVRYDYGNANYEEVSADEMIRDVKQHKENIKNYRIIFDVNNFESLVEYELRDNGSIYAIYGDSEHSVEIDGKIYKNIRYAPWQKVARAADLIYKTDEYDHEITADSEIGKRRARNSQFIQLPNPVDKNSASFDSHDTYGNLYGTNPEQYRFAPIELDTGAHVPASAYSIGGYDVQRSFKTFTDAKAEVREISQRIERLTAALRKIEREFNDGDLPEDEYLKRKTKWSEELEYTQSEYKQQVFKLRKLKDKIEKNIDEKSAQLVTKIRLNVKEFDEAIKKGRELMNRLEALKNTSIRANMPATRSLTRLHQQLISSITDLEEAQRDLIKALEEYGANSPLTAADAQSVEKKQAAYDELFNQFVQTQSQELEKSYSEIDRIQEEIKVIEDKLATLRPKAAAAKAARAAKNKAAEIDPMLIDILDFSDDDSDDSD